MKNSNKALQYTISAVRIPSYKKKVTKITIQNTALKVSILPEIGGRIYELISRKDKSSYTFINSSPIQTTLGKNKYRDGGWKAIGGIEYSFPDQEHGAVYDQPFSYTIKESSKEIVVSLQCQAKKSYTAGLELQIQITLKKDASYVSITATTHNPLFNGFKRIQFWINAMIAFNNKPVQYSDIECIYPKSLKSVLVHSSSIPSLYAKQLLPFNTSIAKYDNWKRKGSLSFFTKKVAGCKIVSHKYTQGVHITFPKKTYTKFFGFGNTLYKKYSIHDTQYVELWSGLQKDFWTNTLFFPGQSKTFTIHITPYKNDSQKR